MITRLQVKGFKNLLDVDVRFGPLTCIVGANGVGKSNLFDAIFFLSELADKPFVEAVRRIRGSERLRGLFPAHGEPCMTLVAEMLIPAVGEDDFSQHAEASTTFVRYEVRLRFEDASHQLQPRLRLEHESLSYIKKGDARRHLGFPHKKAWRDSVVVSRRTTPIISTEHNTVRLHSDRAKDPHKTKRGGGQASAFPLDKLPRTVLSSAKNADETRTAVLVRQEMLNWRLLQLEPTAMRQPDDFESQSALTPTGAHIPAALFRIAAQQGDPAAEERVLSQVANRLARLVEGVGKIWIDRDEKRQALTLMMADRHGLELPASALSDGVLRFLALTVLAQDPQETGLICLEEPENGIHPQRIEAILDLLHEIAVNVDEPVSDDNPLRQVIVNTHSPLVAGWVAPDELLFAETLATRVAGRRIPEMQLRYLPNTWRNKVLGEGNTIQLGQILAYLRGLELQPTVTPRSRVIDRFDQQLLLPSVAAYRVPFPCSKA